MNDSHSGATDIQAPTPAPEPTTTAPEPAKAPMGLALTALIVGIVAFFTGLIPVVGLILGLIAIVFGIIALVKKQSKGLAITGLSLGAVALITSLVASLIAGALTAATISAVDEVAQLGEVTTESSSDEASDDAAGAEGTRDNPLPLGSTVESSDWSVTLNSFTPDVSAEVAAANMYNEPAAEGYQYVMVDLSATYKGADEGSSMFVSLDYVTADGNVISAWDSIVTGIEPRFGQASMYEGATDTGKLVFAVPATLDGQLRVTPGLFADDVFFALS